MKTQILIFPAPAKTVEKTVKPEPVNLNDIDVMTPQIDYMSDEKADWLLIVGVVIMGVAAVASWIIG